MSLETFKQDLIKEGLNAEDLAPDGVCFEYTIPTGDNAGCKVYIGMSDMGVYPANMPSKIHVKEIDKLPSYPIKEKGVNDSVFGNDWKYWSRSFKNWGHSEKNIKTFLANLKDIFEKAGKEP